MYERAIHNLEGNVEPHHPVLQSTRTNLAALPREGKISSGSRVLSEDEHPEEEPAHD